MATKRMYYYRITGKNGHSPKVFYCKAESMADAKILFYLKVGDNIDYVLKITKVTYEKNRK